MVGVEISATTVVGGYAIAGLAQRGVERQKRVRKDAVSGLCYQWFHDIGVECCSGVDHADKACLCLWIAFSFTVPVGICYEGSLSLW